MIRQLATAIASIAILLAPAAPLTTHVSIEPVPMLGPETAPSIVHEVKFSPRGGCTEAVVGAIESACESVHVQAYSFTSQPIAEALVRAHKRGVTVQIVLDRGQRTARGSQARTSWDAGINVKFDAEHAIAHNKVIVIDASAGDCAVVTGSFNFTAAAESSNAENCLIVRGDPKLTAQYETNFQSHRKHSDPM